MSETNQINTPRLLKTLNDFIDWARDKIPYRDYLKVVRIIHAISKTLETNLPIIEAVGGDEQFPYITYNEKLDRHRVLHRDEATGLGWCPGCRRSYTEFSTPKGGLQNDYHPAIRKGGIPELICLRCRCG